MRRRTLAFVITAIVAGLGLSMSAPAMATSSTPGKASSVTVHMKAPAGKSHVMKLPSHRITPHDCAPISPHFAYIYNQEPNAWGCATTAEIPYKDGAYQEFTYGEMDWSPSQGTNMVATGREYFNTDATGTSAGILFGWGPSDPFNYGDWLVKFWHNGQDVGGDRECGPDSGLVNFFCGRTTGDVWWSPVATSNNRSEYYIFEVEGCDINAFGAHDCKQSWTIPVEMWL